MADEIVGVKVKVDGSEVGASVGSLKKQLKEAQAEVQNLSDKFGATSKAAIEAAKRAAELKDRIGDAKSLVEAFNPDAKFKALTSSLAGVAGGFAAVQGAIGLFGVESKEVEKTLLKVQSAMALSQGLQSVGESIDSFKQLGAVIKNSTAFIKLNEIANKAAAGAMKLFGVAVETTSTSFKVLKGAIAATGIGLVVIAIGELISAFQNWQSEAEKTKQKQDELNKTIQSGAKTALQAELAFIERDGQLQVARAKARGASEKEILDIENVNRKLRISAQERFHKEISKIDVDAAIASENEVKKEQANIELANLGYEANKLKAKKDANAKLLAEEKAAAEKLEAGRVAARKAGEAFTNLVVDNKEKQKEKDAADKEKQDKLDEENLEKQFDLERKVQQAQQETSDKKILNDKKVAADEQAILDARLIGQTQFASQIGNIFGQLSNLFEKGTAASKVAAVAEIAIQSGVGLVQGLDIAQKSAKGTGPAAAFAFPIFYATQIAAVLGAVSKAKAALSSVKGGGSTSMPSMSMASAPMAPSAPIQNTLTQLNQGSINQLGSATSRAYVVESDVTSGQEKIRRLNRAARLG